MKRLEGKEAPVAGGSHGIRAAVFKAWGIVYLASDQSRLMTGSKLVIDGGYTAH